jgi:hypothetical protein
MMKWKNGSVRLRRGQKRQNLRQRLMNRTWISSGKTKLLWNGKCRSWKTGGSGQEYLGADLEIREEYDFHDLSMVARHLLSEMPVSAKNNGESDPDLTPSYHGEKCLGNGGHPGIECCCDNCDYYLACFPDWQEQT